MRLRTTVLRLVSAMTLCAGLALSGSSQALANASTQLSFDSAGISTTSSNVGRGSFDDLYSFTLSSVTDLVVSATSLYSTDRYMNWDISPFKLAIYEGSVSMNNLVGFASGLSVGKTFSVGASLANLEAGTYIAEISGKGTGANGGLYVLNLAVPAPVPEPGEWALMLSGMGLIGFIARRRISRSA